VSSDNPSSGAPAGWYPDPLGLPQLRWWNNRAWTEQTSVAHQPLIVQDAMFAWADDELPTRRRERAREREQERAARPPVADDDTTEAGLRELDAPRGADVADQASEPPLASPTPQPAATNGAEDKWWSTAQGTAPQESPAALRGTITSNTGPSWVIAVLPLAQLVVVLLLVTSLGGSTDLGTTFLTVLAAPYLVTIVLAIVDRRALRRRGLLRPAHWTWAFLTAPIYLIVRARATLRESGDGAGPILVWFAFGVLQLASIVAIPGILIAAVPTVFAAQVERSVQLQAATIAPGAVAVDCPGIPPVIAGQDLSCSIRSTSTTSTVVVALERSNGWISWQVVNWGSYPVSG
jgi:Protein of unknown function (DUF2510)